MIRDVKAEREPRHTFTCTERPIYGSSRVGMDVTKVIYTTETEALPEGEAVRLLGNKQYEISNHLGNVLVVVSDIKIIVQDAGTITGYQAQIISATDYSPFGVGLEGRNWSAGSGYRYGFQAQEQDAELWEGAVNYKYRVEDPRLGRFFSVDPLFGDYPFWTVYAFSANSPICTKELEGLEPTMDFLYDVNEWLKVKNLQAQSELTSGEIDQVAYGRRIIWVTGPNPIDGMTIYRCTDCTDAQGRTDQKHRMKRPVVIDNSVVYEDIEKDYSHPIYKAVLGPLNDMALAEKFKVDNISVGRFGMLINPEIDGKYELDSERNLVARSYAIFYANKSEENGILVWGGDGKNSTEIASQMITKLREDGYTGRVGIASKGSGQAEYFIVGLGPKTSYVDGSLETTD
jgi:RHS repeat-associated protein